MNEPTFLEKKWARAAASGTAHQEKALGWGLYATPRNTGQWDRYLSRGYGGLRTLKDAASLDLAELRDISRQLFAQMGTLGGAIIDKNTYAFGDSWKPRYTGANPKWGQAAEEWLIHSFYPACDKRGQPFDFITALFLDGVAMDVDGDAAMILTRAESGFPMLQFLPAHRIGSRADEIQGGPFDGAKCVNGVIINRDGRAIGYNVLGEKPEDDQQLSTYNCQLLYEPEWIAQSRGIPRIARTLLDWLDIQDVRMMIKRAIKIQSVRGIAHYTETGEAPTALQVLTGKTSGAVNDKVPFETIEVGESLIMRAGTGEKIENLGSNLPHPNTDRFLEELERGGLLAVGWSRDLMDPTNNGGAGTRQAQDKGRHSVASRQRTGRKRVMRAIPYALAVAMKEGWLPRNEDAVDAFRKWQFDLPALLTVDAGYDRAADVEDLKLGLTTEAVIVAKRGQFGRNVREERKAEVISHLDDAKELAARYEIPIASALELLQQRSPNPAPIQTPAPAHNQSTK